jgi:hypothetical protein
METRIELIGYSNEFRNSNKIGWGCGYVLIPLSHPFADVKLLLNNDTYFYPQIEGFSEEITYAEIEDDFLKIGFDTAHSWNNETHNKDFVERKANELKAFIDSYTIINAKLEVQKMFEDLKVKFKNYL